MMLMQTNPDSLPELWRSFSDRMAQGKIFSILSDGELQCEQIAPIAGRAENCTVLKFRSADVVRFGSSGRQAMGPYFGLKKQGNRVMLIEYAADRQLNPGTDKDIRENLQGLVVSVFFFEKEINEMVIPIPVQGMEIEGCIIEAYKGGTLVKRTDGW